MATKKQKAAKRDKIDKETKGNIKTPVEAVKESKDKIKVPDKKQDKKGKGK